MSSVLRETASGLLLAEQPQDVRQIERQLKQIDDRFVLQQHGPYWKVLQVNSWDSEDAVVSVVTWCDTHGRPLPLSSGLIDEVQKWRPEARSRRGPDAEQRNAKLAEDARRLRAVNDEEIVAEHRPYVERGRTQVTLASVARKPAWLKKNRGRISR